MKKLMTMIAAVATCFGLYATDTNYGTSFEAPVQVGPLFEDTTGEAAKWNPSADTDAKVLVKDYATAGIGKVTGDARPVQFVGADQYNYLDVKTALGKPIERTLDTEWDLANGNFFFDSLVRFTNFDSDPENIDANAKIAIWTKEVEEDNVIVGTNLMVTARGADGQSANFVVKTGWTPALADGWSRVTVKAIPSILKTGTMPGFVVWVDQEMVGCAEAMAVTTGLTLSDVAADYNAEGKLFVSMVQGGDDISTISAVAFDGQGQIDDVSLTSVAPTFAADPQFFNIVAGENVESITVDGQDYTFGTPLKLENIPYTFTVEATYAQGYIDGVWTATAGATAVMDKHQFIVSAGGATGTIVAKAALVKVGGKSFETLAEAFADVDAIVAADGLVELAGDITLDNALSINLKAGEPEADVTAILDLAGKTITFEEEEEFAITAATPLTIKDSSEQKTGTIVAAKAVSASATLAVEGGIIKGKFAFSDMAISGGAFTMESLTWDEVGEFEISGGTFDDEVGEEFAFKDQLADGKMPVYNETNGYWEIVADNRFTVTVVDALENSKIASIVVDGTEVEEPVADDYKAAMKVVVTYEANEGYKFVDPTLATQEFTAADTSVAPAVVAKTYVAQIGNDKYETLQAALTAAENGDTVIVLDDIEDEILSLTGNGKDEFKITISNDCNVVWTKDAGSQQYGFKINAATVTFTGTGTWQKEAGTASIIQAGATTAADLIVESGTFISGKSADDSNNDGKVPSNALASKKGNITINGGTFRNFRTDEGRCARVEGNPSVLTVNGGYFTVPTEQAGGTNKVSVESRIVPVDNRGKEGATVVINGGSFMGKADQIEELINGNKWCGEGFKLKLNGDWYVKTAIEYSTLKLTSDEGVKTLTATNAEGVAFNDGAKFDKDLAVKLYASYELNETGVELDAEKSVLEATMDQDEVVIKVITKTLAPEYDPTSDDPEKIPDNETAAARYGDKVPTTLADVSAKSICTWAKGNGKLALGATILEDAFLLNCENDPTVVEAAKKNFKATSITINSDGTVTVGTPDGALYNGTIKTLGKAELSDAEWSEDLADKKFFELKLVPTNLN